MTSFKKNDFLENAKFMSGLANGYFLFEKKGILIMSLFSCCLSRVFMTVEQEYTSLNAQMDEVWSGIVWMTSLRDSFKKPKLKTILVLKYLHTKLVELKLSLFLHHVLSRIWRNVVLDVHRSQHGVHISKTDFRYSWLGYLFVVTYEWGEKGEGVSHEENLVLNLQGLTPVFCHFSICQGNRKFELMFKVGSLIRGIGWPKGSFSVG